MDPLSLSATLIALLQGTSSVVKYIRDVKEGGKEREGLMIEMSRLVQLLDKLKKELDEAEEEDPWFESYMTLTQPDGALENLQQLVSELDRELQPQSRFHQLGQKLSWPLSKNRVKETLESIRRYSAEIERLLSRGHFDLSKSMYSDVQALAEQDAQESFDAMTSWLSPLRSEARQSELIGNAITSGKWLFESSEFKGWVEGDYRTLMCYGAPGVGKTMLSSLVIDHLQRTLDMPKTPILYLYLNHKEGREQNLTNLIGSLLKQLIQYTGQVPKTIRDLYVDGKKKGVRPATKDICDLFKQELASVSKVFITVDALDESDEDTRKDLIDYLLGITSGKTSMLWTARSLGDMVGHRSQTCNLCGFTCGHCSSGDDAECQEYLEHRTLCQQPGYRAATDHASIKMPIIAQDEEIRTYIDKRIKESNRLHRVCQKDPSLINKITDAIIDSAQGIFLIARLQIDFLRCKPPASKPILAALKNLPTTPKELYAEAVTRIQSQNPEDVEIAMRLLRWVLFAYRPLTFEQLQHAMGVNPGDVDLENGELLDEEFLFSLTAGLVSIDAEGAAVRFIHFTVYEYLTEHQDALFSGSSNDIVMSILTYLNFESFSEPCRGEQEDEEFEQRLEQYPLLSYASQYWGQHASESYRYDKAVRAAVLTLVRDPLKLASSIQAAWYTSYHWEVRKGISSLHVCAWFGLDEIIPDLLEQGLEIDSPDLTYGQTPLMYACKNGRMFTVKTLLRLGADINSVSMRGSTALMEALLVKNLDIAEHLVDQPKLDVNAKASNQWGRTVLMIGTYYKYVEFVRLLLGRSDVLVNAQDIGGHTALHIAVINNCYELVQLILGFQQTDTALRNQHGESPLIVAARYGREDIVQLLLETGADTSIRDELGGTAILRAVDKGSTATVKMMLKHSVDFREVDDLGRTILHGASINGHCDIIRLLVEAGLAVDVQGAAGETPLHDASRAGNARVAETLLELGANPLITDNAGRTPRIAAVQRGKEDVALILEKRELQLGLAIGKIDDSSLPAWAIAHRNCPNLMKALIARGGNLDEKDPDTHHTALHVACWFGYMEILEQLLPAGANPNIINKFYRTPLQQAVLRGNIKATEMLLQYDARADVEGETRSALTLAQERQHFEIANLLIKANAKIDTTTMPIQPTFFAAVTLGDAEAVRILIMHGAETQTRDSTGHTALQLAKIYDRPEVMRVLREHKSFSISSRTASMDTTASSPGQAIITEDPISAHPCT